MSKIMSEEFPHRRSGADFGFDSLERTVPYRRPNRSLLGLAVASDGVASETRPMAASRLSPTMAAAEPAPTEDLPYRQAAAARTISVPAHEKEPAPPVTLEKVGDFLELDFRRLFVWLKAGLAAALALALVGALAGAAYGIMAKKRYTVATDVLINPVNLQVMDNDLYPQSSQVDGQVLTTRSKQRVLTSRNVLARVVDDLDLGKDPEFVSATGGAASDPKLAALMKLQQDVNTEADDKSFVTTLLVTAATPDKGIEISRAIVAAFQKELAKTEAEGASRAAAALDARLQQLKSAVLTAENKVAAYKRDHGLSASNGQLVSSQTLTQLNTQIVAARARAAAAQANYDALIADGANGTSASSEVSQTLAELRSRANQARQDLDSQSVQLGPRHPSIQKLKVQLDTINAQLKAEYRRTVEVAKADRDAAKKAMDSLETQMSGLQGNVFSDGESEVALRELERDAASRTGIYESFLSRARQITEQEQIDTTNVQVISEAVPPKGRSWPPRTMLLIGLGAFGGFALGMLLALANGIRRDLAGPPDDPRASRA